MTAIVGTARHCLVDVLQRGGFDLGDHFVFAWLGLREILEAR